MQFIPSTFAAYAVSATGGVPSPYDPADSLYTAARYLCADGGGSNWKQAVFQYCGGNSPATGAAEQCRAYVAEVGVEVADFRR